MPVWIILVILAIALLAGGGVFVLEEVGASQAEETHNDVFGFVYAVVGVAYAVLLGLIVVGLWTTLDEAQANTFTESDAVLAIAWYGHSLPQPEHGEILQLASRYTDLVINTELAL